MKKWILIGGAALIVMVVFLVLGISNLGPLIKNAVNTYGPKMTKTQVRLEDVSISIFSAEAKLKGFLLGNPTGFKSPEAMKVGSVYVDVDEGSLTGETLIIDKIEVIRPEITYEKARGTDNFKTILNNVNSAVSSGKPPKKQPVEEGGGKKIMIKNFIVSGGTVNLAASLLAGKTISASLPDIHLKDIGKQEGGTSPATAFGQIFATLYQKITSPAVTESMNQALKTLGSNIEAVGKNAEKDLERAGADAKKKFESTGEDAKEELDAVADKVKGLFGK